MNHAVDAVRLAADRERLLIVTGAGVSMGMTDEPKAPSWTGLISNGLAFGLARDLINPSQFDRNVSALESTDIDDLLGVAEFLTRKLASAGSDIYARWLESALGNLKAQKNPLGVAIAGIAQRKIPIATLNFDTIIEQVINQKSIDISDVKGALNWIKREHEGVLHLHGVWSDPKTCILGIRDYHDAINDERRTFLQNSIAASNRILFIGCGATFDDPNFRSMIAWMRSNIGEAMPQHYALVQSLDYEKRLADPAWMGFVEPISYGESHDDLAGFLEKLFPPAPIIKNSTRKRRQKADPFQGAAVGAYRQFVLRDCGQMTIEGIRADMETAKQRFDIERLFVPLEFDPVHPEALSEAGKEDELEHWKRLHPGGVTFGDVLNKSRGVALLALPGGGKTLLLKRLAVAYADVNRSTDDLDKLPKFDALPIMIRCREWKEYIRSPILIILDKLFEITGDAGLEGFGKEIRPLLKSGKVLLLIDGLDEIHEDASREVFVEHLEKFLESHPKVKFVITSREAGFDLVAPTITRFCERWKIAPLPEKSIRLLCDHWHDLMVGNKAEASTDAENVADDLLSNPSLRRLAENPLLLTMLLVVKHGAGRLPPDRVSLYSRATEVLLDTWNKKGHDALNIREAVPQLACLAFELLKQGKQTATVREMVGILEEARERIPHISRYAKDDAVAFLKRVELRSSLLVESGHRREGIETVPFYQFRHLTFQEYLSAVAITNGHYLDYNKDHNVLTPLQDVMLADRWKEVVPMVAVLAGKQASPLLQALADDGAKNLQDILEEGASFNRFGRMESASRITQSFIEEAEFTADILPVCYKLVAIYANGCATDDNWAALARGPYGSDLREQAWNLYLYRGCVLGLGLRNTVALLDAYAQTEEFWSDPTSLNIMINRLADQDQVSAARAALLVCGSYWHRRAESIFANSDVHNAVAELLLTENEAVFIAACWAFAFCRYLIIEKGGVQYDVANRNVLNRIVLGFTDGNAIEKDIAAFAIETLSDLNREEWALSLEDAKIVELRKDIEAGLEEGSDDWLDAPTIILAYFTNGAVPNVLIKRALRAIKKQSRIRDVATLFPLYDHYAIKRPKDSYSRT